ncbi:MAG: hypothetical protein IKC52_03050 [Clostridia bacterium]|nr:hypothetical protein [Clostridia bacterium]
MKNGKKTTLLLTVTAMYSALAVCGKVALASLPNVEVVTILIAVCAFCWGLKVGFGVVFAFVLGNVAVWGVNTWVISYVVHFNVVALCFGILGKTGMRGAKSIVFSTILAVVLTALFGVLTSAIDTAIGWTGVGFFVDWQNFFARFAVMYVNGIAFYVTHVLCNAVLFAVAFLPLCKVNFRVQRKFGL